MIMHRETDLNAPQNGQVAQFLQLLEARGRLPRPRADHPLSQEQAMILEAERLNAQYFKAFGSGSEGGPANGT